MANKRRFPLDAPSRVRPRKSSSKHRPLPYLAGDAVDRTDTGEHIGLVEIDWDTGTEYYSFVGIQSPSAYYDDLVMSVSPIRREVALTGGAFSVGTATVDLVNRDRQFSIKWANTSARGRKLRVKFVSIPLGLASAITLFEGRITGYSLSNDVFHVEARDTKYDELFAGTITQTVPLIVASNFPNLVGNVQPAVAPLVFGRIANAWTQGLGGTVTGTVAGAAIGTLVDTAAAGNPFIYIFGARPHGAESAAFTNDAFYNYEASTVLGTRTTKTYGTVTYSILSFLAEQRVASRLNEPEITGYITGFTEDDSTSSQPILNPVRALEYLLDTYTSLSLSDFDTTLQTMAKTAATSMRYDDDFAQTITVSGTPAFRTVLAAFISDPSLTWANIIEKFCESFCMQLFATREGKLATFVDQDTLTTTSDLSISDESDIIKDSMYISNNTEIASVLQYNHAYNWSLARRGNIGDGFQLKTDYVIPGEKANIGGYDIRRILNMEFVGPTTRAIDVARVAAEYYKSGAQWIEFDLPIRWFRYVELNRYAAITHWQGVSSTGGYSSVIARILEIETTVNPQSAHIHLKCFKKVSYIQGKDSFIRADSNSLGTGWSESESATTVLQILSNQLRMSTFSNSRGVALRTETYGNNQLARMKIITRGVTINGNGGICVRGSGSYSIFTGYAAVIMHDNPSGLLTLGLYKFSAQDINTGGTLLASTTGAQGNFVDGDKIELRADGTSITVYVYSQEPARTGLMLHITDSNITSGTPGVLTYDGGGSITVKTQDWCEFDARDF